MVAVVLEAAQGEEGDQVAHVKAVGRGVEAGVKGRRTFGEALGQRIEIGAVGIEAAPMELV